MKTMEVAAVSEDLPDWTRHALVGTSPMDAQVFIIVQGERHT